LQEGFYSARTVFGFGTFGAATITPNNSCPAGIIWRVKFCFIQKIQIQISSKIIQKNSQFFCLILGKIDILCRNIALKVAEYYYFGQHAPKK